MNFFAGPAVDQVKWQEIRNGGYGQTIVHREPIGVVGAIVAWNVPLFLAVNKLGPALLAGCTVVLKPAAETPLSANALAEVFAEAGLPEGVLSVVPGGIETGQALTSNRDIDLFSFTGSSAVGKEIGRRAAELLKPCTLELGGKSAAIILDDVDLAAAIPMLVFSGIMNTGQACVAQTRILAPRSRYDEIVDAVSAFVQALPVGTPSDPAAQIGSLISEKQRARVEGYIAKGIEEGARLVCGGGRPEGLDNGFFVQPTVFADVDNKMTIAQEEIFGPVLSIIPYDTEEDAIKIANDSAYGLAGSVWTTNVPHGIEISEKIRTGTYAINWYAFDPCCPFGGYKNSGIGRENGPEGVEHFTQQKSVLMPMGYTLDSCSEQLGCTASGPEAAPSLDERLHALGGVLAGEQLATWGAVADRGRLTFARQCADASVARTPNGAARSAMVCAISRPGQAPRRRRPPPGPARCGAPRRRRTRRR